ncbi:tRNA uridine-5-carboxymethylaminomethyl(34) synthesis GTPase MnmE [Porphyromonas circumdentaria]|uniref:tRNA modification GTPase MnmE n=1 Tax=Porphyromonas circumdentaria TaxID=29524 RepID=A0A1T4KMH4_9PORP|nr:tRNA uridine-5-carboxymethylaminomethyl(34) synthesis GTPase MnmE [Porphyromonas circumdentaria]MBB6274984.1 tRNA modification GTPase [Porphyromonas circumdentaria]SJZ43578.1 tRNA modification GTPase [Porphyromonas circumdentaria]
MSVDNFTTTTICAVATAPGVGGIGIVRISGPEAFSIALRLFHYRGQSLSPENIKPRYAYYGEIIADEELIDEVVLTSFRAPHSFTGEDTVEISCHGSVYIRRRLLESLLKEGCEMATAGEFTRRAYLNGRMDLSRAEAVADIIASESKAQHQMAMKQLKGGYSEELNALREELLRLTGLMELELDFPEEDVEFADRTELLVLCDKIECKLRRLIDSYRLGNAVKRGIPVAIVGTTNVGKSTLLNNLLGEERAIVSDIHGTTRDTIEDTIHIGGYLFRFVDTAGLRQTEDAIESLGIERSRAKIQEADIILSVLDATRLDEAHQLEHLKEIWDDRAHRTMLILINKSEDLDEVAQQSMARRIHEAIAEEVLCLFISARSGLGIESVQQELVTIMDEAKAGEADLIVSNARHHQLLQEAYDALGRMRSGFDAGLSADLLTLDLRHAIHSIGAITGREISSDDTLHYIFAHFCIGK